MEVLGFTISVLMGVSLGLLGGGGSIFAVPVLVYIFGIDATHSSMYSNFMVGITAGIGFYGYYLRNLICFKSALGFLLPALTSLFWFKEFLIPQFPDTFQVFNIQPVSKSSLILIITGLLMIIASIRMFSKNENKGINRSNEVKPVYLNLSGMVIGGLSAFIGIGGGFLIVPALAVFAKLPMKKAIGTALFIILLKSIMGFLIDFNQYQFDWTFLIKFSAFGMVGMLAGIYLSGLVSNEKLKKGFAWLIFGVGSMVLIKELFIQPINL